MRNPLDAEIGDSRSRSDVPDVFAERVKMLKSHARVLQTIQDLDLDFSSPRKTTKDLNFGICSLYRQTGIRFGSKTAFVPFSPYRIVKLCDIPRALPLKKFEVFPPLLGTAKIRNFPVLSSTKETSASEQSSLISFETSSCHRYSRNSAVFS